MTLTHISTPPILTLKILKILKKESQERVLRVLRVLRYRRLPSQGLPRSLRVLPLRHLSPRRMQRMVSILPPRTTTRRSLAILTRSRYDHAGPTPAASRTGRGADALSRWHHPLSRSQRHLDAALLDGMRQHKQELHALVEEWSERAAIAEYGGGLAREDAERLAWQCFLEEVPT